MLFSYFVHRKSSETSECKKEYLCLDLDQFSTEHVYNRF